MGTGTKERPTERRRRLPHRRTKELGQVDWAQNHWVDQKKVGGMMQTKMKYLLLVLVLVTTTVDAEVDPCHLDTDGNRMIDFSDFLVFARLFGTSTGDCVPSPRSPDVDSLAVLGVLRDSINSIKRIANDAEESVTHLQERVSKLEGDLAETQRRLTASNDAFNSLAQTRCPEPDEPEPQPEPPQQPQPEPPTQTCPETLSVVEDLKGMGGCIDYFSYNWDRYCRLDSGCTPVIDSDCCASLIVYPETVTDSDCSLLGGIRRVRDGVVYCRTDRSYENNPFPYEPRIEPQPVNVEPPHPCDIVIKVLDGIFLDGHVQTLDEIKTALVFWPGSLIYRMFYEEPHIYWEDDQQFLLVARLWAGNVTRKQRIAKANEWFGCQ